MDERDEVIRLDYIQRKKLEMELAREEAIFAQEKQAQDNKENAIKMKIEATKRLEEREKNFKEEFDKKIEINLEEAVEIVTMTPLPTTADDESDLF